MDHGKACVTCKHCCPLTTGRFALGYLCTHPRSEEHSYDMITGESHINYMTCDYMRYNDCGKSGVFFEQKEPPPPTTFAMLKSKINHFVQKGIQWIAK